MIGCLYLTFSLFFFFKITRKVIKDYDEIFKNLDNCKKGIDDEILLVIQITVWIQEFLKDFLTLYS